MARHNITPDAEKGIDREMIDAAEAYAALIQEKITSPNALVFLEQRVDFSRWVPGGFGTCDCLIIQDRRLTVIDFKYGEGVPVAAVDNPQIGLYALGALDLFDGIYEIEEVEKCIFQPRIDNISEDLVTTTELLAWGDSIKPVAEQAARGEGEYTPGEHCRFCAHAGRCRALAQLCTKPVKNLYGQMVAVESLAPHELSELLALEPQVTLFYKQAKAHAMRTMLAGGEIPGYKVVTGKLGNRKWLNEVTACKDLEAAGYSRADITETHLLSPAQLEKALGKKNVAEFLEQHTHRAPGSPTIAKDSDYRPAYNRLAEAIKDFD